MESLSRNYPRRAWLRTLFAALAVLVVGGMQTGPALAQDPNAPRPQNPTPNEKPATVIGDVNIDPTQPLKPDFIINVSVVGETEPSGNYQVDSAGNIPIRYAGIMTPVMVKGLTPAQAEDAIKLFLKTYVKNPQVKVSIVSIPRPVVFVSGAVRNPGSINIGPDTTLIDVLSRVEWTENADLTQVRLTRIEKADDGTTKSVPITLNFENYIHPAPGAVADDKNNPVLKDKDRIFVGFKTLPGNGVVSIGGEVTKPAQNVPLRSNPPMTVREVINLVGGTTTLANRKGITIRRPTVDRPLVIDLDKAEQGDLVNNIELKPDDAIYVEKLENNAFINLNGGFVKPGKFVYDKRTTLSQAVMEGGGVAPFSKVRKGRIFRHPDNDPKNTVVIPFNWTELADGKLQDIELQPGDSVWIEPGQPNPKTPLDWFTGLQALSNVALTLRIFSGRY